MSKGFLSDFFGFSEEQAGKDVDAGHAAARSDAEECAKADWMMDDVNDSSSPSGSK
ncbi:MAG: hypothetical protein Q7R89_01165 [bacterium]|nr:hypothetical protein [bacterium]